MDLAGGRNPIVTQPVTYDGHRFQNPEQALRYQQKLMTSQNAENASRQSDFDQLRVLGDRMTLASSMMHQRIQAENDRRAMFAQRLDLARARANGYRIDPTALPMNLQNMRIGY
jgi:hypothetical protein